MSPLTRLTESATAFVVAATAFAAALAVLLETLADAGVVVSAAVGAGVVGGALLVRRSARASDDPPSPRAPARTPERTPDPAHVPSVFDQDLYAIEDWEEIFEIDPDDHSRHSYVIRLVIRALVETVPGFSWYVHYTGSGEQTRPATAGAPVVRGAEFLGYVPAERLVPGWTGWRLRFDRPLDAGERVEVSVVQTFHDTQGSFQPVFRVDAPVRAPRLVLRVRFPATALPSQIHGFVTGPHPAVVIPRRPELRKVEGRPRPLVEAVMAVKPIPHCVYGIEWDKPATGKASGKRAPSGGEQSRTDLAFSSRKRSRA